MIWIWLGFFALILGLLALDLGVFHRDPRAVGLKEALGWSAVWMASALVFAGFIFLAYSRHWAGLGLELDPLNGRTNTGGTSVIKYLTVYLLEKSLSIDNIFVISLLFTSQRVPAAHQHRVLFLGVLGAIVMRGVMIGLGVELISRFHWIFFFFGVLLIFTAIKMLVGRSVSHAKPLRQGFFVRWSARVLPITERYHGSRLTVPADKAARARAWLPLPFMLTPLALALIAIEASDLLFATDSIPAAFAITGDPFLIFTSNIFAILGLRSLYFALAGLIDRFRHLKTSLAVVLGVVGTKMLFGTWLTEVLGTWTDLWLLGVVLAILAAGMVASRSAPAAKSS